MYIPADFRQDDREAALELIRAEPFAMLVTAGKDQEPLITHLPICIARSEPDLILGAHVARANPHWRSLDASRVTVIFRGPHGYVSPRWYSDVQRNVPTWNYTVVHCIGTAAISDEAGKAAILEQLVNEMEAGAQPPWRIELMDREYGDALKRNIVAFYIRVESVAAKFKLSQNRTAEDRGRVIAALSESGRNGDRELAAAMARQAERDTPEGT